MPLVSMNSKYGTAIRYFLLATVCMLLLPLFSYGDIKNGGQPDVSDTPIQKKQLKTIIVDNYYPYTFVNQNGDPDGFSIDLIRAVAQEMGLELKIDVDTWELARNALKNGDIDVLPMMAYSKERDQVFDFSVPHTIAYDAFFTRKNGSKIRSLDDLHGKKIIVMKDDQAHDYLRSIGLIGPQQLILVDSLPDALRLLTSGKGDAALMPKLVGLIVAKNLKLNNLELSPIVIEDYKRPFSFAVAEGNQSLLERLSQGLSIVKTSDQYSKIYEKWFGALKPPGLSMRTVLKYIGGIILVFIVIGSVLVFWSFSLRRQVALRTRTLNEEITERKQAEEAVRESEQKYRSLVESTEDSIYLVDRNSTYLFMNKQHLSRLGLQPDEFLRRTYSEFHSEDDTQEFAAIVEKVFETGRPIQQEHRSLKDNKHFLRTLSPVRESDGRTRAITVVSKDITERVRSEEALRKSEEKYRTILESIEDGYYEVDIAGNFTFFNDSLVRMVGYSEDELMGLNYHQYTAPEDTERVYQAFNRVFTTGKPLEGFDWEFNRKDGSKIQMEISVSSVKDSEGQTIGFRGIVRDITEKKKAEEALEESGKKYKILTESSLTGIFIHQDGKYVFVNDRFAQIHGYKSEELLVKDYLTLIHPDERGAVKQRASKRLKGKAVPQRYEIKRLRKDGKTIWCEIMVTLIQYSGRPAIMGNIIDITEREQAKADLLYLKEYNEKIVASIPSSLLVLDRNLNIKSVNRTYLETGGIKDEDVVGKNIKEVFPHHILKDGGLLQALEEVMATKEPRSLYEVKHASSGHPEKTLNIRVSGLRRAEEEEEEEEELILVIEDITERARLQEEIRKKNEELENFVYVVSHDLKSPIVSMQGFSSMLLNEYREKLGEEGGRYIERIRANASRMEVLISDLLALSRVGRVVGAIKDASSLEIVNRVCNGLKSRMEENRIEVFIGDNLPTIRCDGDRIYQVFENLVVNAVKFTGGAEEPKIEIGYEEKGEFHQFYVRDNGIGIDPRYHRKIFEIFQRLKEIEDEEGTGIGLVIVERIVKNHGGKIWVESEKGMGATFYFTLPGQSGHAE